MQAAAQNADDAITLEIDRVLKREVNEQRLKALLETPGSFDCDLWALAREQGWCGLALPESVGGLGLGWRDLAEVARILGETTVSLPLLQNTLTARLLLDSKNAGEFTSCVAALASGEQTACWAVSSAEDAGLAEESPVLLNNGSLQGRTGFCAFAAIADVALVYAQDSNGPVLALATLDQSVVRNTADLVDNARAMAALEFNGTNAIVLEGVQDVLRELLAIAAVITAFEQIGGASAAMELARQYAMEHRAFGQPIGAFQAIKHKIADIYTSIEIARGCALEALDALVQGNLSLSATAAARIGASRAYDYAAQEAIQVHGGMGITWEGFVHHHYRRARSLSLELGSNAYWRNVLLDELVADQTAGERV